MWGRRQKPIMGDKTKTDGTLALKPTRHSAPSAPVSGGQAGYQPPPPPAWTALSRRRLLPALSSQASPEIPRPLPWPRQTPSGGKGGPTCVSSERHRGWDGGSRTCLDDRCWATHGTIAISWHKSLLYTLLRHEITIPPVFKASLLHSKKSASIEKGGVGNISPRAIHIPVLSALESSRCGVTELSKLGPQGGVLS